MKRISIYHLILTFAVVFITTNYSIAQLTTDDSPSPASLVNSLVGTGIVVSSLSYTGSPAARGAFNEEAVDSTHGKWIGLKSGVILSTGYISNATGPNNDPKYGYCNPLYITHNTSGTPGDTDLDTIAGCSGCTLDAAVLEFTFIPEYSPLSFRYVFASEEYPCWVCSQYNAVFAFLVTSLENDGLNYHRENVALIPGTAMPVCINSINSGTAGYDSVNQEYYNNCISLNYSKYFVNNGDGSTPAKNPNVQYNGFTVPLTATIDVMPYKQYHIKLAIANAYDEYYDSAVLLEAKGFANSINNYSNPQNEINIYPNPANDIVTIDYQGYTGKDKTTMELYSVTGNLIKTQLIQSALTEVNISDLAEGVYIVKVTNDDGVAVKKFVKE